MGLVTVYVNNHYHRHGVTTGATGYNQSTSVKISSAHSGHNHIDKALYLVNLLSCMSSDPCNPSCKNIQLPPCGT